MSNPNRRSFLKSTLASVSVAASPAIIKADQSGLNGTTETIIGGGENLYRVDHHIAQLPSKYHWQHTHNVAVDSGNNFYVIHEGKRELKDHPAIFVFDPQGKFIRAFGSEFQGGGHGIEIRKEGNAEYIYVAAYQGVKAFAKLTLDGEIVWYKKAPMESGVYRIGQDISTNATWERKGFLPTNIAFLDDGGFLLADGYGSYFIHQFNRNAEWVKCFGGAGEGKGTFEIAHGLWVDKRPARNESTLVVTDRKRGTLQRLTLEGQHIETLEGFRRPCNVDTWQNLMVVSEINQRVTLLDEKNQVVARLGDGEQYYRSVKGLANQPDKWKDGEFLHPHDACFDSEGNIFVAERIGLGRITKLTRMS